MVLAQHASYVGKKLMDFSMRHPNYRLKSLRLLNNRKKPSKNLRLLIMRVTRIMMEKKQILMNSEWMMKMTWKRPLLLADIINKLKGNRRIQMIVKTVEEY